MIPLIFGRIFSVAPPSGSFCLAVGFCEHRPLIRIREEWEAFDSDPILVSVL